MRFLVADFGSSSLRVLVIDECGRVLDGAARPVNDMARASAPLGPPALWTRLGEMVRELPPDARRVAGIGVSAQLSVVLADEGGLPVAPLWTHVDQWAQDEALQLRERLGVALSVTGRRASAELAAPRLLWLRRNEPELFERVRHLTTLKDYMIQRMTGRWVTDETSASYTSLYDVYRRAWSDALVEGCDLSATLLPRVLPAVDVSGAVTGEAAAHLGIEEGLPVAVGAPDGSLGAVGAGAVVAGMSADVAGTTDVLVHVLDRPVQVGGGPAVVNAFAQPEQWTIGGPTGITGGAVDWLARLLGYDSAAELYARWDESADAVARGADGLLFVTTLAGDRFPGWRSGHRGTLQGLTAAHSPATLIRAAEEGAACLVALGFAALAEAGVEAREIRMVGGAARSRRAVRLRAEVCDLPVLVMEAREGSALGAAMCAAVAAGAYANLPEAAEAMVRIADRVVPERRGVVEMAQVLARWRRAWEA